jgi:preprotein translocase subunit SecA
MTARLLAADAALARSAYPERSDKPHHAADRWARVLADGARRALLPPVRQEVALLARAQQADAPALAALDATALRQQVRARAGAAVHGLARADLHAVLPPLAEVAQRTLGLRPYPVQLFGAATLLRGRLAEMNTGEGKTLTAGLAATLAALAGVPVHVVTVNDYLAARDAAQLAPLFEFFGLRVGVVVHGMDPEAKRAAYGCDITYCTNKELVFDYLRDRVALRGRASAVRLRAGALFDQRPQPLLLRGLHLAIVDEADSILIDEARTPLILAEKAGPVPLAEALAPALALAAQLQPGTHFGIDTGRRELHLTQAGCAELARLAQPLAARRAAPWAAAHAREHLVAQALRALHLFQRDQHYLVDAENKVQIIDEYTGRVLPGRNWEQGLHQLIETKEGVPPSELTRTLARITYQRFFARYLRLAGMTGTGRELARELAAVYRLSTVCVPPHRPNRRRHLPLRVSRDAAAKWQAVADEVARAHARGQPVLVGTRSVEASDALAAVLVARGLPHRVLNARQDAEEAATVAAAGQRGAVTVATNMAGRGTDITLGEGVAALGGLLVLLTEYHESMRIDRQLLGRCARQGDPGTCRALVARDDPLFGEHAAGWQWLQPLAAAAPGPLARGLWRWLRWRAQARAERIHARTRRDTLKRDHDLDRMMAFSGDAI